VEAGRLRYLLSSGEVEELVTAETQSEDAGGGVKEPRPLWRKLLDRALWVVLAVLAYTLVEILVPAWPCPYAHHGRAVKKTQDRIRKVENLAYSLRRFSGHYPRSLAQLAERARDLVGPEVFTDGWGRPFIYRVPGRVNSHAFDLFSMGLDGVDDGGRGDDITNWSAPEPLYYGRDHHRGWLSSTAFDVFAAFALGWLIWVLCRWRRLYYPALKRGRVVLRWLSLPRWIGPGVALVAVTVAFLHFPALKARYYCWRWAYLMSYPSLEKECGYWRWTRLLPRPPEGPHTNMDDAAETLIYMGPSAAPVVAAIVKHPGLAGRNKMLVRERTVRLLGLMGDPSVVPTLRKLLLLPPKDPHYVPHAVVARALRRLGDRSAVWILFDDIGSRRGATPFRSARALELLTWHSFGDLSPDLPPEETRRRVALWSEWWRLNQQREEPEWLGQGVEQAIGQLTSDDVYLRAGASRRLERVTGIRFFYRYYMPLKERRTVASLWRRWWKEHRDRFRYADFDSIDQRFRTVDRLYDLEW